MDLERLETRTSMRQASFDWKLPKDSEFDGPQGQNRCPTPFFFKKRF